MQKTLTNQQLSDKVGRTVSFMKYQPLQDYDFFYPTLEELDSLGTIDENGDVQYDEYELAFLAWVTRPADPASVSEEYKHIMRYAIQLRADFASAVSNHDAQEEAAKMAILAKYNKKHKERQLKTQKH